MVFTLLLYGANNPVAVRWMSVEEVAVAAMPGGPVYLTREPLEKQ